MKISTYISLGLIILISLILRFFIFHFLPINQLASEPLLFSELQGRPISIPSAIIIVFGVVNLLLLFYLGRVINQKVGLIASFLYAISPWTIFLELAGSFYIFLLSLLLIIFSSLKLINTKKQFGVTILIVSTSTMIYSFFMSFLILPLLILSLVKINLLAGKNLKVYLISILILSLPLFILFASNITGFKNIAAKQVSLFSNIGLINAVNDFRGETSRSKFAFIGKYIENRYFYLSEHLIFNFLKQITPLTYFTQEFKMFNFSFSPPIFVGLLVPFLMGLKYFFRLMIKYKWILLINLALILPSMLSDNSPNQNRLILIAPTIFLITSIGLNELFHSKNSAGKTLLLVVIGLVVIQSLTTIFDISLREEIRFEKSQIR